MLEGLIFLAIYNWLAIQHPGKNLIEINELVFGKYLGKALSWLYLLFFLYVSAELLRTFASFFAIVMTGTPLMVFLIIPLLIASFAIRYGLEVISRYSQIVSIVVIIIFCFDFILLFPNIKISNFLPFMDISLPKMLVAIQGIAALPFGEAVVFLMIISCLSNPVAAARSMKKSFIFAGLFLTLFAARTITVLGPYAAASTYPGFATIRLINIADVFSRVEIILAMLYLSLGFVKGSLFYYGSVVGAAQLLNMRSYRPLILPIGALLLNISMLVYEEYIYDLIDAGLLFPFYSMIFAFFLPLLTLIVAKIKKTGYEQEVKHAA